MIINLNKHDQEKQHHQSPLFDAIMDTFSVKEYFSTKIYRLEKPQWLDDFNEVCDVHMAIAYENYKPKLQSLEDQLGPDHFNHVKDFGISYHSDSSLLHEDKIQDHVQYITDSAYNILDDQGFDLRGYKAIYNDFWVQEFSRRGGGHHGAHVHSNGHISGFYFLKTGKFGSKPAFHDPRPGALMTKLPQKNSMAVTEASEYIYYNPLPGTLMLFNSYVPHEYMIDDGYEEFRFVHFNIQFIKE